MAAMMRTGTNERTETAVRQEACRGAVGPGGLNGYLLSLQRTAGNAAVQRMLAPAPATPLPGAGPERESPAGEGAGAVLPGSVAEHAEVIDADTRASVGAVQTASQRRRTELTAQEAQVGRGMDAGFGGAIRRAGSAVEGAIGRVAGWLRGTAGSVVHAVTGIASGAAGLAAGAAARVRAGAAAAHSMVDTTVGRVASGVLSFARGLPIPNLPGVGRVRSWILGAAERVAGRVQSAISRVTGFVASVVGETAGLVERVARTAQGAIRRVGDAVRSMIDRGIAAISGALRRVIRAVTSALRSAWTTAQAALRRLFGTSAGHITAVEHDAMARI